MRFIKNLAEFEEVLKSNTVVAVDFTASWCGPCKRIGPVFESLASEFPSICFVKVDVDEAQDVAEKNGISAMPTFIFFKDGEKVDDMRGANEEKLKELIQKFSS